MTAAELLVRAGHIAVIRRLAIYVVCGVAFGGLLGLARCSGERAGRANAAIGASVHRTDTLMVERARITDTVRIATAARVRVERVTVALHDTVRLVDSVTVAIQTAPDSVVRVEVPAVVVRRLVADSVLISAQRDELGAVHRLVRSDSLVIGQQAVTIQLLESRRAPRCGMKCGIVIGGAGFAGVAYLVAQVVR